MIPQNATPEQRLVVLLLQLCRKGYDVIKRKGRDFNDLFQDMPERGVDHWQLIGKIFIREFNVEREIDKEIILKRVTVSFTYEDISNCILNVKVSEILGIEYEYTFTPIIGGRAPRVIIIPKKPNTVWQLSAEEMIELVTSLLEALG